MTENKIICQSCGMPLANVNDFGTQADGVLSAEYCRYCYQSGKFTDQGITMEQKIEKNIAIAKQMGMSDEQAKELAQKTIPHLKRWR